jgi:hypothetical protein
MFVGWMIAVVQSSVFIFGSGADGKRCCDVFIMGSRARNGREETGMFVSKLCLKFINII